MLTAPAPYPFAPGSAIAEVDRPAWLEARRNGVGASESADLLGVGHGTPLALWMRKRGELPPIEETEAMRVGTLLEPTIARLYEERTGHHLLRRQVFVYRPDFPWAFATLDAVREDGRPVELKCVGLHAARDWGPESDGPDGVPHRVVVQAQHQMIASGAGVVDVAALLGTELRVYALARQEWLADGIRDAVGWFREALDRGVAPDPRLPAGDGRLLARLFPEAEGAVGLAGEAARAASEYLDLGARVRELTGLRDDARDIVLAAMGGHALAELPDGRRLARRVVVTKERTQVVKATTYATLTLKKGDRDAGE